MDDPIIRESMRKNPRTQKMVHRDGFIKNWKRMKKDLAIFNTPHKNQRQMLVEKENDFRKNQIVRKLFT